MMVSATGDWTRNTPKEEYPAIRRIYELFGKPELVETVLIDAPHNYNQASREAVYRFFAKHILNAKDTAAIKDELRARVIAFDARRLDRVPVRIGVAGGQSKVRPILGALRSGSLTVLVSDVQTAEAVLALDSVGAAA